MSKKKKIPENIIQRIVDVAENDTYLENQLIESATNLANELKIGEGFVDGDVLIDEAIEIYRQAFFGTYIKNKNRKEK